MHSTFVTLPDGRQACLPACPLTCRLFQPNHNWVTVTVGQRVGLFNMLSFSLSSARCCCCCCFAYLRLDKSHHQFTTHLLGSDTCTFVSIAPDKQDSLLQLHGQGANAQILCSPCCPNTARLARQNCTKCIPYFGYSRVCLHGNPILAYRINNNPDHTL